MSVCQRLFPVEDSALILFNVGAIHRPQSVPQYHLYHGSYQRKGNVDTHRGWMLSGSGLCFLLGAYHWLMKWGVTTFFFFLNPLSSGDKINYTLCKWSLVTATLCQIEIH